jgi:hypothetical protein
MNEDILPAILSDEAQPFFVIPPFDFAFSHILSPECLRETRQPSIGTSLEQSMPGTATGAAYASGYVWTLAVLKKVVKHCRVPSKKW